MMIAQVAIEPRKGAAVFFPRNRILEAFCSALAVVSPNDYSIVISTRAAEIDGLMFAYAFALAPARPACLDHQNQTV